jgi:hypothetical protein
MKMSEIEIFNNKNNVFTKKYKKKTTAATINTFIVII